MSTLISTANLIVEADAVGAIYTNVREGIDTALGLAQTLAGEEQTSIFASDTAQFLEWIGATQGMYGGNGAYSGSGSGSAFGALAGFGGGGAFGGGTGVLSRFALIPMLLYSKFESMRQEIAKYGSQASSSVVDLGSFAAYYNGLTPYTILYTPSLAAAFYYAYGGAQQLPAAAVFAPEGLALDTCTITATDTLTQTLGTLPQANGYSSPASSTDSAGYPLYLGGMPCAQGFAPVKNVEALITTTINGTCALSVTMNKAGGGTDTWTGSLSSATAGSKISLSPGTGGSRPIAAPAATSDVTISGTATAGAFVVQTGAPERVYM